jgi:hypothetical protein
MVLATLGYPMAWLPKANELGEAKYACAFAFGLTAANASRVMIAIPIRVDSEESLMIQPHNLTEWYLPAGKPGYTAGPTIN